MTTIIGSILPSAMRLSSATFAAFRIRDWRRVPHGGNCPMGDVGRLIRCTRLRLTRGALRRSARDSKERNAANAQDSQEKLHDNRTGFSYSLDRSTQANPE